jgi:hypothetical protein
MALWSAALSSPLAAGREDNRCTMSGGVFQCLESTLVIALDDSALFSRHAFPCFRQLGPVTGR